MAEVFFWCAALLLLHTYFFYPLCLFAIEGVAQVFHNLRGMRSGENRHLEHRPGSLPTVSLVVAAYNEASCIRQKLENSLALDYPADRFEVVIGSDGSTDGTDDIVRACADRRVRLSPAGSSVIVTSPASPPTQAKAIRCVAVCARGSRHPRSLRTWNSNVPLRAVSIAVPFTSPSPWAACPSPVEKSAPSFKTGR